MATRRREWNHASSEPAHSSTVEGKRPIGYVRAVVFLAAVLLLAAGLEAAAGDWSYTQLTLGRSMAAAVAGWGLTLFWAGLAGGRVALGIGGHRFEPMRLLDIGVAISLVSTLLYWLAPPLVSTFVALPLLGFAVSIIYPLLLSLTPARVGASLTGLAVGLGLAAGTIGGGALPAAIGLILQGVGLFTLGPVLTIMAAGLLVLHAVSRRAAPRSVRLEVDQPVS